MGDRKTATEFYNAAVTAANDKSQPSYLAHAYSMFSSACMVDPTFGSAFYQAGNNNSDLELLPAAVACWRRALQCDITDDERGKLLVNMGWRLHSLGRTEEALRVTLKALKLNDKLALGWLNLSMIKGIMDDAKGSVKAARQAFETDPNDLHTHIALAFALLFDGQYAEGFKFFERRFEWRLHNFLHFPYPKWLGDEGKTVYLVADQGLGDTLSFSRFVERAAKKCKFIHAAVQPELLRLFSLSLGHISNLNLIPMPGPFPEADCWTTFVSLAFALGLTDEEIRKQPSIHVDFWKAIDSWKVPDRKLHIGIAWGGSALNDIDKHRNIPLENFFELYRVPGVQLYSLQVDSRSKELQDAGSAAVIRDLAPYIRDVTDTLSILQHLDLVITCESALGHISALAGKECWIPYSYSGRDYRIGLHGEKLLWTPKHRVFMQGPDRQWAPVFDRIVQELNNRVQS